MNLFKRQMAVTTGLVLSVAAGIAAAGGYGYYPQGMGYGPGSGYGAPYGRPPMTPPPRPQRPTPPPRPQMGPYGYRGAMQRPYMPGAYAQPGQAETAQASATAPAAPAATAAVTISQMRFGTGPVTIKAGGSVTWTNNDGMPHTVTANDGSFGSEQFSAGGSFTHTFDKPGTYSYYCALHPTMRGTVVVEG